MKTTGLHHVAIAVDDVAAALRFYVEDLGFSVNPDRPSTITIEGAWLDVGDGANQIHIIKAEPQTGPFHFALAVDDLDAAIAELVAKGHEVREPTSFGFSRQTVVRDPAGNPVELRQSLVVS